MPRPSAQDNGPQPKLTQSDALAKVIFIESILTDEAVITKNIVASKVGVKDYCGIDAEQAPHAVHALLHARYTRAARALPWHCS